MTDISTSAPLNEEAVLNALRTIQLTGSTEDIVTAQRVSGLTLVEVREGVQVVFAIESDPSEADRMEPVRQAAEKAVLALHGVFSVTAVLAAHRKIDAPSLKVAAGSVTKPALPGVRHVLAVASGKGGVGKSTTAVNLAVAMAAEGWRVGLLDADLFGPSVPRMMGMTGRPVVGLDDKIKPFFRHGILAMSIGSLISEDAPVVWRGPMMHGALRQLLRDVTWGEMDVLVIDLPPGTGDTHISISQLVSVSGAVIVSTPQDIALLDARRCVGMFDRVSIPILGVIENMSYFLCPHCGGRSDIFNNGGAKNEADRLGVPFLGAVPLDLALRQTSDAGMPIVVDKPEGPQAKLYREMARCLMQSLEAGSKTD